MPAAETIVLFPSLPGDEARALAEAGGDALAVVNAADEKTARNSPAKGLRPVGGRLCLAAFSGVLHGKFLRHTTLVCCAMRLALRRAFTWL